MSAKVRIPSQLWRSLGYLELLTTSQLNLLKGLFWGWGVCVYAAHREVSGQLGSWNRQGSVVWAIPCSLQVCLWKKKTFSPWTWQIIHFYKKNSEPLAGITPEGGIIGRKTSCDLSSPSEALSPLTRPHPLNHWNIPEARCSGHCCCSLGHPSLSTVVLQSNFTGKNRKKPKECLEPKECRFWLAFPKTCDGTFLNKTLAKLTKLRWGM